MGLGALIPLFGIASAISGAVKHSQDKKEYERKMRQRDRRRTFSAFTGDRVLEEEPEAPSAVRSIFGGGVMGANIGMGLASGLNNLYGNPYAQSLGNDVSRNLMDVYSPGQLAYNKNMYNGYSGGY